MVNKSGKSTSLGKTPLPSTTLSSSAGQDQHSASTIPPQLCTHPDPLLRRCRLVDAHGHAVNLQHEFRDTVVVGFLFGQAWNGSVDKSAPLYSLTHEFTRLHPHQFKCVYVEAGVGRQDYERATKGKLWLSMEFEDGSGQLEESDDSTLATITARGETFLLPGDDIQEPLESPHHDSAHAADSTSTSTTKKSTSSSSPSSASSYLPPPPISRAYLTDYRNVLAAPNLQIYHLPTRKWLTSGAGVRPQVLVKGRRIETWDKWERGQTVELKFMDYVIALRYTIALFVLAMGYLMASKQDPSIDLVHLAEKILNRRTN